MKSIFDNDLINWHPDGLGTITFSTKEEASDFTIDVYSEVIYHEDFMDFHQINQANNKYYLVWTDPLNGGLSKRALIVGYLNG